MLAVERDGRVALVGDAAHAIVPFFGQGANAAFEDCIELDPLLDEHRRDWTTALAEYEQRRKANADAIAAMPLQNFIEMRDKVNSRCSAPKTACSTRWTPQRRAGTCPATSWCPSPRPYAQIRRRMRSRTGWWPAPGIAAGAAAAGLIATLLRRRSG